MYFSSLALALALGASDTGPYVIDARYEDDRALALLLARTAPWRVDRRARTVRLDVPDRFTWQSIEKLGFKVELNEALTAALQNLPTRGSGGGIPGFSCIRTVDESYARMQQLVSSHPQRAALIDIGDSWRKTNGQPGGSDLLVLKISNSAIAGPKPVIFMQGGLHAREYITSETLLRFGEFLLSNYGVDPDVTWIVDQHNIQILVHANPDGRRIAETIGTQLQRKNRNSNHCPAGGTQVGVDLNRNFPFNFAGPGGSPDECTEVYWGVSASSEPETAAIIAHVQSIFPDQRAESPGLDLTTPVSPEATGIYLDVHSNAGMTLWPWGSVDGVLAPSATALQTLGRKMSFYSLLTPQQANMGGAIGGTTEDYVYGTRGVASFTIELGGTTFFPDCTVYEQQLLTPNINALLIASKVPRTPYLTPAGPELTQTSVTPAIASASGSFLIRARADDGRFNNTVGTEPTQIVTAAEALTTPPWGTITGVFPMIASDGSFSASAEDVEVTIPGSAVPEGRHLIYLQALDAGGNTGPVTAVFVERSDVGEIFASRFE